MRHKTIKVTELIDEVNRLNKQSTLSADARLGWNMLLEHMLHETETYAGFGYYKADQLEGGARGGPPGIIMVEGVPNQFPDDTRRFYYYHKRLTTHQHPTRKPPK